MHTIVTMRTTTIAVAAILLVTRDSWSFVTFPNKHGRLGRYNMIQNVPKESYTDSNQMQCSDTEGTMTSSPNTESCPFSKTFPRYRIDLTSFKEEDFVIPFFSGIQSAMAKSKLMREFKNVHWLQGQDGVEAFASLWRYVATLSHSESSQQQSVVVAFPDSKKRLLLRWIDILEWSQEEPLLETAVHRVDAKLLEHTPVPALQLMRVGGPMRVTSDNPVHPSVVTKRTQSWVKRILVDLGICPFTKSVTKSGQGLGDLGVPVGSIAYHTSNSNQIYDLMADTWKAIQDMLVAGPSGKNGVSSILLAAPAFDDDFDMWAGPVFAMLEAGVIAAGAEREVGVVCFHPRYATPDGRSWPGFGHMHSVPRLQQWLRENDSSQELSADEVAAGGAWQRRTPHATINVLRADQLEIAEKRRTTGNLYADNICKLVGKAGVGSAKLAEDLEFERQLTS